MAEDPAHSEMTKPRETISPRPRVSTSSTVGAMICCTTLSLKIVSLNVMIFPWMLSTSCWPNHSPRKPRLPSRPSSSGGSDSVVQKAASAASEKMLSFQARDTVLPISRNGPRRGVGVLVAS